MKKVYLLGALGGLLLASCANDDLVVKPVTGTDVGDVAIAFVPTAGNMSRTDNTLRQQGYENFGVWAFKAAQASDLYGLDMTTTTLEVMPNYRVNYEYTPHYGSYWTYVTSEWATPVAGITQYLKYWDGAYAHTYFFGYAPYTTSDVEFAFTADGATLKFPSYVMSASASGNYVYSDVQVENNAEHIAATADNTTVDPKKVPLTFHRVFSQLQIAFYEDIPGYKVELKDVQFAGTDKGAVAIPADRQVADANNDVWTRGGYVNQANPYVYYKDTDFGKADLYCVSAKRVTTDNDIWFALPTAGGEKSNLDANGNIADGLASGFVATTNSSYSPTVYNVIPTSGTGLNITTDDAWGDSPTAITANSGLQFVVNYDLKSEDTNEVIHVKNARVYVAQTYTAWQRNTMYTYIFRITKNSSGNTVGTDPADDPEEPTPCLYPIIFDKIEIADLENAITEIFDITDLVMSQTTASVAVGADLQLTVTDPTVPDAIAATWESSNAAVATVDGTGKVHGEAIGSAIITATYSGKTATCVVTVTAAP